jgi:hypothetical protein
LIVSSVRRFHRRIPMQTFPASALHALTGP